MVKFDICTLTSPKLTRSELQQLCDEISKLRLACERLADEIDVVSARKASHLLNTVLVFNWVFLLAPRSPAVTPHSRSQRRPPPIPAALRCLSLQQSPFHSQLPSLDTSGLQFPPAHPPSYNDVMRETGRRDTPVTSSLPIIVDDVSEGEWSCSLCTFLNYPLLNQCEQCDMPRINQGITITSSSYKPLRQNNQLQGGASVASNNESAVIASAFV